MWDMSPVPVNNTSTHPALGVSSEARERVLGDLRESQRERLEKVTVAALL